MSPEKKQKKEIKLTPIGYVKANEDNSEYWIEISAQYRSALKELEKFTHAHIFWWADQNDNADGRSVLVSEELPPFYGENAPSMGVFANRSEFRPNPIMVTITPIFDLDQKKGIIRVPWMDAFPGTPVVDIKPYLRMSDLITKAKYPPYLEHWPKNQEKAVEWFSKQMEMGS